MNKTKYLFIVAVAVLSLALLGSSSFAAISERWVEGTVEGGYSRNTFDLTDLIGYEV